MTPLQRAARPEVVTEEIPRGRPAWIELVTSADHKDVGRMYIATSLFFAAIALTELVMMRLQLLLPDNTLMRPEIFDRLLSAYGVTALAALRAAAADGPDLARDAAADRRPRVRPGRAPRASPSGSTSSAGSSIYASFLYRPSEAGTIALPPLSGIEFLEPRAVDAWLAGIALDPARLHQLRGEHGRDAALVARAGHGLAPDAAVLLRRLDRDRLHAARGQPDHAGRDRRC